MCDDCKPTESPNLQRGIDPGFCPKSAGSGANAIGGDYCLSDEEKLDQIFKYHPPNPSTGPKFETLREAARHFARVILMNVPPSAERSAAIRHVRDAVMTANAGVSLDGLSL